MRSLLHGRHPCRRHRRGSAGAAAGERQRPCVPRSSCKNRFRRTSRSHTWCKTYSGIPSQQTASVAIILSLRDPNVLRNIGHSLRTPAKRAGPYPVTRTLGQRSASGHSSHLGLRASRKLHGGHQHPVRSPKTRMPNALDTKQPDRTASIISFHLHYFAIMAIPTL